MYDYKESPFMLGVGFTFDCNLKGVFFHDSGKCFQISLNKKKNMNCKKNKAGPYKDKKYRFLSI
jgi:hypothetical protein